MLNAINGDLLPSARTDKVKDVVQQAQKMAEERLRHAQEVQACLGR